MQYSPFSVHLAYASHLPFNAVEARDDFLLVVRVSVMGCVHDAAPRNAEILILPLKIPLFSWQIYPIGVYCDDGH